MRKRVQKEKRLLLERKASHYSRELRERATPAERVLLAAIHAQGWRCAFQSSQFTHGRFARLFIADFRLWLPNGLPLIVEVDGSVHVGREAHDAWRTQWLEKAKRATVIRFTNQQVLNDLPYVIAVLSKHKPLVDPLHVSEVTPPGRFERVSLDIVSMPPPEAEWCISYDRHGRR